MSPVDRMIRRPPPADTTGVAMSATDVPPPSARRDRVLILAAATLRATATGLIAVVIGLHLARTGFDARTIGMVVSAGLGGMSVATLFVTLRADRIGRRRTLVLLALAAGGGTAWVAGLGSPAGWIAAAAFLGMLNGMGRDRGAALVLEQAILPAVAPGSQRTRTFAMFNVAQDIGHALGGLLAGAPALLGPWLHLDESGALRAALFACAALLALPIPLYLMLSAAVEHDRAPRLVVSPESRPLLARISALFLLDALGGGFLTTAGLTLIFAQRFGVGAAVLGPLFFAARILNALSHLGAAWLARRIGLVNTMVFTHLPSSLLLVTVAVVPSFPVAAALFLLREGLVEMDVPTRQSYVMAVVLPGERTAAAGVTSLVRTAGWAVGPVLAGTLMQSGSVTAPLVVGATMKIAYDLLLYTAFRRVRPPEERRAAP